MLHAYSIAELSSLLYVHAKPGTYKRPTRGISETSDYLVNIVAVTQMTEGAYQSASKRLHVD
jgi:hypothetical protein